jgi:hypothetical protein
MEKVRLNIIGDVGGIITVNGIFCGELEDNIVSLSCRLPCFIIFNPFKQRTDEGLEYATTSIKLYYDPASGEICSNSQNALITVYPKQNIQLVLKPAIIKNYSPPALLKEEIYDYLGAPLKISLKRGGGDVLECSYENRTFFHTLPRGMSDCIISVKEFYGTPYIFFTATKAGRLYFALIKYVGSSEDTGDEGEADGNGIGGGDKHDSYVRSGDGSPDGYDNNAKGGNGGHNDWCGGGFDDFSLEFCDEIGSLQRDGDMFTTVDDLSDMARHSQIRQYQIAENSIKQISNKSGYVYGIPAVGRAVGKGGADTRKEPRLIPFYFFEAVKAAAFKEAASYLSSRLSKNITAGGEADFFKAFFGDFINVLPNIYVAEYPDSIALIYKTRYGNTARLYKIYIDDGLIENIEECT